MTAPDGHRRKARRQTRYTGVATVPGATPLPVFREHSAKYAFAAGYVADRVVLDVGCASGMGVDLFARSGARRVVGVELDPDTLWFDPERYRRRGASLVQGDVCHLPIASRSIDVVVMLEIIEHIAADTRALDEVARVMRADGTLIFSTPNHTVSRNRNPHHVREYDLRQFRSLLQARFGTVELYGQCYVSRPRLTVKLGADALLGAGQRVAAWLGVRPILGAARRRLSPAIPIVSDEEIRAERLDPTCAVVPHAPDERSVPAYLLAVCRL